MIHTSHAQHLNLLDGYVTCLREGCGRTVVQLDSSIDSNAGDGGITRGFGAFTAYQVTAFLTNECPVVNMWLSGMFGLPTLISGRQRYESPFPSQTAFIVSSPTLQFQSSVGVGLYAPRPTLISPPVPVYQSRALASDDQSRTAIPHGQARAGRGSHPEQETVWNSQRFSGSCPEEG